MTTLTFAQFAATQRTPDDELWAQVQEHIPADVSRDECFAFADGNLIHEKGGEYFVHAWWYAPIGYKTLEVAIAHLFPWYVELA